jgi:hypothetical protein
MRLGLFELNEGIPCKKCRYHISELIIDSIDSNCNEFRCIYQCRECGHQFIKYLNLSNKS